MAVRCFTSTVLYLETDPAKQDITGLIITFVFTFCQIVSVLQILYFDVIKIRNKKEN